jgi:FKBP-type peptidyl-prolyl cis-trans isomerase SlyD
MGTTRYGQGKRSIFIITLSLGFLLATSGYAQDTVGEGTRVSLEYTLTLEDQTVIDTNVGKDPLVYTHGSREIIPGLEKQLIGLKVGDTKNVEVAPAEGYGEVDPNRVQEVPKENVPEEAWGVGKKLQGRGPDGGMMFAEVTEVRENTVIVDLNHPLAGRTLFFAVKVLNIEAAEAQKVDMPGTAPATKQ